MSGVKTTTLHLALAAFAIAGLGVMALSRPLTAAKTSTIEMADMTWIEIRDAVLAGRTTVLVPSGGIEANGPHMVTGKHQHIVGLAARLIAERHGAALVAPVLSLVPQGDYAPPTGNMQLPGTIGIPPETFEATLEGVARSLKAAGFRRIVFMADHGQSQIPQAAVATRLHAAWKADGVEVLALGDYYARGDAAQQRILAGHGETPDTIGNHAGLQDTAELMFAHPAGVRMDRLARPFTLFGSDGASGRPERATADIGQTLIRAKVDAALEQLRAAGF